jgi:colanic acid biosynthesis glycosyl transferase WcaI
MRILINSINFLPELTSTGKYTGEMAQWLAGRGHHVRVVTSPPHYPRWKVFDDYSSWRFKKERWLPPAGTGVLEIFRCPTWIPRRPRGWRRLAYLASFSLSSWPVMLAQIRWKPHLILLIEPTFFCCPQVLVSAWLSRAVSWLHIQDFEVDVAFQLADFSSPHLRGWVHHIERRLLGKFAGVSTISMRMMERLPAKGVEPSRTVLFPNWVDSTAIYPLPGPSPLRDELGIGAGMIVALYSGNMGLKQGLPMLIDVSQRLAARRDICFVICGEGPHRDELVAMAQNAKNILFLPLQPVERLNDLLNLADIHLLPQLGGAADLVMPSKLTGILASGRPVVANADRGTQIATVLEGKGVVTPSGDMDAFAAALSSLADNFELRRELGEAARAYAVAHLNREKIMLDFEHVILNECKLPPSSVENGWQRNCPVDEVGRPGDM